MTGEPAAEALPPGKSISVSPVKSKVRLRFAKGYDLRLLSHHDLIRTFERLLRRAEIPVAYSQGFNPHPRMAFALSLPLGVVGLEEVLEIELREDCSPEDLLARMRPKSPPGLSLQKLRVIDRKTTAQVACLCYRLSVPDDRLASLREQIPSLLQRGELLVSRPKAPRRRIDLRPSIHQLRLVETSSVQPAGLVSEWSASYGQFTLELELIPTPVGTAKPEEVFTWLGQPDLLERGSVLERSRLQVVDEVPPITAEGDSCPRSC